MRDPNNCLAKLRAPVRLRSSGTLKKGLVIEVDPVSNLGWRCGYDRERGTVFVVAEEEFEIIEDPITPRLFYESYQDGEWRYVYE